MCHSKCKSIEKSKIHHNVALQGTLVVKPDKTIYSKITQFTIRSHMISPYTPWVFSMKHGFICTLWCCFGDQAPPHSLLSSTQHLQLWVKTEEFEPNFQSHIPVNSSLNPRNYSQQHQPLLGLGPSFLSFSFPCKVLPL